ncbi:hypothetical protein Pmani_033603 [Petrolisthes manimaculis]|uniref:Uncharacterized protein n=1 Tax=Petrolisthes manimaculis TaxID=1843537 RepID=A0AAE1NP73_9EUCA|nr:hypothetical protein Pmani_033603 [Petrolisthes manimaculis]
MKVMDTTSMTDVVNDMECCRSLGRPEAKLRQRRGDFKPTGMKVMINQMKQASVPSQMTSLGTYSTDTYPDLYQIIWDMNQKADISVDVYAGSIYSGGPITLPLVRWMNGWVWLKGGKDRQIDL